MKRERNAFGKPFGMPLTDAEGNVVGPSYEDVKAQEEDEENMPRVHPSDTKGDVTSLDRMGQRNLYLLIKSKDDREDGKEVWKFPQGEVEKGELLHEVRGILLMAFLFYFDKILVLVGIGSSPRLDCCVRSLHGHMDCQSSTHRRIQSAIAIRYPQSKYLIA